MKKLEFNEELKREDWEPLDGKWYALDESKNVFSNFTIYNVNLTRLGILLYSENGAFSAPCEDYKRFGKYSESQLAFGMFRMFIDNFVNEKLVEISEDDAVFALQKFQDKQRLDEELSAFSKERTSKVKELDDEIRKRLFDK